MPAARLTWHQGSVLPLASLWHTVHRVAALNAIKVSELPFKVSRRDRPPERANLLFNSTVRFGACAGEALSVSTLAAALGEPAEAFAWSHLGGLPQSCGCLFVSGLPIIPSRGRRIFPTHQRQGAIDGNGISTGQRAGSELR